MRYESNFATIVQDTTFSGKEREHELLESEEVRLEHESRVRE